MITKFIIFGALGWCMEVLWTGLVSLVKKDDIRLISTTSIWMFFIYGMGSFIGLLFPFVLHLNFFARGLIYMLCIFFVEYATGRIMQKLKICPWDYSDSKFHIHGVIRLDYAPLWFGAGLLFERVFLWI